MALSKTAVRVSISDEVPPVVVKYFEDNAEDVASQINVRAKATTEFEDETGKLRKSIKAEKIPEWKGDIGGYWIVKATAPHAHLVEFGHQQISKKGIVVGHVPAHSFLRTALESVISDAKSKFGVR